MAVDGGEPEQRTFDSVRITGVDWTADGKHLVFASERGGASGLWRVGASGGEPTWVLTGGEGTTVEALSIARRGNRLVYTQRSSNTNIWRLWQPQPTVPYRAHLFLSSTRWESHPHIAPDGTRIAFASNQSGTYEIWRCDRSGGDLVQLTTLGGAWAGAPRWSPDGRFISFVAYRDGQADIYVVDAEGGTPRLLTSAVADDTAPRWSHDGRWIYFASNRNASWQVWKIPVAGGDAVQVTTTGGWAALESPDGTALFYVKPDAPGIWQRPLIPQTHAAPAEKRLIADLDPADRDNWAVTPQGIYFVRRDAYAPVLALYRFATEQVTDVATLNHVPQHPSLAVAPEETWFLYTQVDRNESDLLLIEHYR
jgi:Tol biopolymer transport system component